MSRDYESGLRVAALPLRVRALGTLMEQNHWFVPAHLESPSGVAEPLRGQHRSNRRPPAHAE